MISDGPGWAAASGSALTVWVIVCSHGDLRNEDVAVGHGQHAEVFLRARLAARGELGDSRPRSRFGGLAAGVRIDFGVEHEDVDVPSPEASTWSTPEKPMS